MENRIFLLTWLLAAALAVSLFSSGCGDDDDDDSDGDGDDDDGDGVGTPGGYAIVDTGQSLCYDDSDTASCSASGEYAGQDAQYDGNQPSYEDNGDGTVTDLVTGLMWQQDPGEKMSWNEADDGADSFELAGYDDWRLPTIKELYSLMRFTGTDPDPAAEDSSDLTPFINDDVFAFEYGDTGAGERIIDSQWITSTIYDSTVMDGQTCFFGVNFADGRIKCYPLESNSQGYFALHVRNAGTYGGNDFEDLGDGTVNDAATGLMWQRADNGEGVKWAEALDTCESLELAGHDDWRLPNAKELQSIVDYSRSPDTTDSAAIDPVFDATSITNEEGVADWGFYWTSTTHVSAGGTAGARAAYVSFGRALGYMDGEWQDVHGAGAQRSDPKNGDADDYPQGEGPQGDAIRVDNFARCVRQGWTEDGTDDDAGDDSDDDDAADDDAGADNDDAPPQEAVDACDGKTEGDDCSFTAPEGEITGTCEMIDDELACVPEGGPPA